MKPLLVLLPVFFAIACASREVPSLPRWVDVSGVHATGRGALDLEGERLSAVYVIPSARVQEGISSEDGSLALTELVVAVSEQGELFINDVLHAQTTPAFRHGKISPNAIQLSSPQGEFAGKHFLFTPSRDVLTALDTGYQIDVAVRNVSARVVLPPNYDAARYVPFQKSGGAGALGAPGSSPGGSFDGGSGSSGSSGSSGEAGGDGANGADADQAGEDGQGGGDGGDGGDGSTGNPGAHGGNGGRGGSGASGLDGGRGADGGRGERGPDLEIEIRPIYSKFHPFEELVYVKVVARYARGGDESRNYIMHRSQRFTITSRGGDGGAGGGGGRGGGGGDGGGGGEGGEGGEGGDGASNSGGPGGRGGDGGEGGDGGSGGTGAGGGTGGPGGSGGRSGDGGDIRVRLFGDDAFQAEVRRAIDLVSVPGEGGALGPGGGGGSGGSSGSGGDGGKGGDGGSGGSGNPRGDDGQDGAKGSDGSSGSGGNGGGGGADGDPGARGRPGRTPW